jgi:hypothetical protein
VRNGDDDAWADLAEAAAASGGRVAHIFLSAVFAAAEVPPQVLQDGLRVADALRATGDPVAAYRRVSLLRRAGHPRCAILACDDANGVLAAGHASFELADHLSERLIVERNLAIAELDRRTAAGQSTT